MKKNVKKGVLTYSLISTLILSCIIIPNAFFTNNVSKIEEKYSKEFLQEYYDNVEKMLSSDDSKEYFQEIIVELEDKTSKKDGVDVELSQELHINVNTDYSNLEKELEGTIYEYDYIDNNTVKVTSPYQTERLIVTTDNLGETYNATNIVKMPYEAYILEYDSVVDTKVAYEEFSNDTDIKEVIPDTLIYPDEEEIQENATEVHNSWGYETTGFNYIESAITGYGYQEETVVAVIDTGCNVNHEMLSGRIYNQHNIVTGGTDVSDIQGHGTHVSGIIADNTDNNIKIMPLKVMDSNGNMYKSSEIAAIIYASQNDADVINISLGSNDYSDTERQAIIDAKQKGIIVCAAAGNSNVGTTEYPAAYDEAIAVASIDKTLTKSSFSNYGSKIDFAAPGSMIYSAANSSNTAYVYMSGTSMASPHMAAASAMIKSIKNQYTFDEVYTILKEYSIDLGTQGKDIYYGWGYINFENIDMCQCGSTDCHFIYTNCTGKDTATCNLYTLKNFEYQISESNMTITKYIGNDTEYFLPKTLKKYGVTYNVDSQISLIDRIGTDSYIQFIKTETQIQLINDTYKENIKVTNNSSTVVPDSMIGTGMTFEIQGSDGNIITKKTSVIGDLDGNGKISVTDLSRLNQFVVGSITIENEFYKAADLDKSDKVSITDLSKLNQVIVGTSNL